MTESIASPSSSRDVSSAYSLYEVSISDGATDNISTRAIYESNFTEDDSVVPSLSRPLSRSSVTSGLSMIATKDGIEGRKVPRYGIPPYSLNLLNTMNAPGYWKKKHCDDLTKDSLTGPSMTLREKMRLLNSEKNNKYTRESCSEFVDSYVTSTERGRDNGIGKSASTCGSRSQSIGQPGVSEMSNSSTLGDDTSYLQDIESISSMISGRSQEEWSSSQ
ncbi:HHR103Cp [Eremothecium sinecaudum]|uniref:HHR103Cp n=1 Tax=Eremothecium sinecaudum TaxID=45286 RepID=A0A0X8HWQ1_9SACH|nr:HHR103Cp [Eremothecium sinecaudum]AMD22872.1 HHR103Cp [Eremothecium sinecaudum]